MVAQCTLSSVLARTEMLRREMERIEEEERLYRMTAYRSPAITMAHASRKLRLSVIQAELETIQKQEQL